MLTQGSYAGDFKLELNDFFRKGGKIREKMQRSNPYPAL
jgi:hypothetical protein